MQENGGEGKEHFDRVGNMTEVFIVNLDYIGAYIVSIIAYQEEIM